MSLLISQGRRGPGTGILAQTVPTAPVIIGFPLWGQGVLQWDPPADGGSPILNYNVYRDGVLTASPLSTDTQYTDGAAAPNSVHYYRMTAENVNGESAKSNTVAITQPGNAAPDAPVLAGTKGNNVVNLTWSTPASPDAPITGYNVYRSGQLLTPTPLDSTTNAFTDTTAVNGTSYAYRVSALNVNGESAQSNIITLIPSTTPSAPVLSGVPGNNRVDLSWPTPANGGSAITGYKVYRGTPSPLTLIATLGLVNTYPDLTALNGTAYTYRVSAVNVNGEGAQSVAQIFTPQSSGGAPTVPAPVTVGVAANEIGSWTGAWIYFSDAGLKAGVGGTNAGGTAEPSGGRHWTHLWGWAQFLAGGYGGVNRFTGDWTATFDAADGRTGGVWATQSQVVINNFIARCKNLGIGVSGQIRCSNYYAGIGPNGESYKINKPPPFVNPYDDNLWLDYCAPSNAVNPTGTHPSGDGCGAAQAAMAYAWMGCDGSWDDWEPYAISAFTDANGTAHARTPTHEMSEQRDTQHVTLVGVEWVGDLFTARYTIQQLTDKWTQRGAQFAKAILDAWTAGRLHYAGDTNGKMQHEYYQDSSISHTWRSLLFEGSAPASYSAANPSGATQMYLPWFKGVMSDARWGWIELSDSMWYRTVQAVGSNAGMTVEECMQYNSNQFMAWCSQEFAKPVTINGVVRTDIWDLAAKKWGWHAMSWIDQPTTHEFCKNDGSTNANTDGMNEYTWGLFSAMGAKYHCGPSGIAQLVYGHHVDETFTGSDLNLYDWYVNAGNKVDSSHMDATARAALNWPTLHDQRIKKFSDWNNESLANIVNAPAPALVAPILDSLTATAAGGNVTISGSCHDVIGISYVLWEKRSGATVLASGACTHVSTWYYVPRLANVNGYDNEPFTFNTVRPGVVGDWFIVTVVSHDHRAISQRVQAT